MNISDVNKLKLEKLSRIYDWRSHFQYDTEKSISPEQCRVDESENNINHANTFDIAKQSPITTIDSVRDVLFSPSDRVSQIFNPKLDTTPKTVTKRMKGRGRNVNNIVSSPSLFSTNLSDNDDDDLPMNKPKSSHRSKRIIYDSSDDDGTPVINTNKISSDSNNTDLNSVHHAGDNELIGQLNALSIEGGQKSYATLLDKDDSSSDIDRPHDSNGEDEDEVDDGNDDDETMGGFIVDDSMVDAVSDNDEMSGDGDIGIEEEDEEDDYEEEEDSAFDIKLYKTHNSSTKDALLTKKNRDILTKQAYFEFNKKAFNNQLPSDLSVNWSKRLLKTAGRTMIRSQSVGGVKVRISSIELSVKVCDSELRLRTTLLHELCHVAVWLLDGVRKPPHGKRFHFWANRAMRAVTDIQVTTYHDYNIHTPFKWQCNNDACMQVHGRHTKKIGNERNGDVMCGSCNTGTLDFLGSFTTDGTPHKVRAASAFSMFTKNNYASVKRLLHNQATHKEIMSQLSIDYKASSQPQQQPSSKHHQTEIITIIDDSDDEHVNS